MIRLAVAILLVGVSALLVAGCAMSIQSSMEVAGPDAISESTTVRLQINRELLEMLAQTGSQTGDESTTESMNSLDSFGPEIAQSMESDLAKLREQGYTVMEEFDAGSYQFTASKVQTRDEWLAPSEFNAQGQRSFAVKEQDGQRRYRVAVSMGGDSSGLNSSLFPSPGSSVTSTDSLEGLRAIMDMRLTWRVTLPGQIVDTNAPTVEGQTAIWTLDIYSAGAGTSEEWYAESVETIAP